ncbi:DUF488 domain-containing protein [Heyndrickxia acidiproducens]|jgi:uncharacterized protein YeaO (DUF488 family)|uniref:DUF488 domain-containing protein n=1 Tax=Heyndrickxia acidiproducens TaxID=1121084 RepID=UPI000373CFAE|nr:DUF488 domain-containing protein [Heyndrickxia acidiproducens]
MFKLKRIYDEAGQGDGRRVLVDRVWPRGISKEKANLDDWMKTVAPSTELRKWFNHDAEKFAAFENRYRQELDNLADRTELNRLMNWGREGTVTLLYGAKDESHNQAVILKAYLESHIV